ncbi:hypothetical protein GS584_08315 [Rhodococcus hoagii]|nr:hypothetical protein [Prescottella equi]
MALDVGTLYATLTVKDDQFTSGLNRAEGRLNTVDKTVQKTTKSTVALGAAGANAGKATGQGAQQATAGVNSLAAALGKAKNMAGVLGVTMGAAGAVKFFTDAVQNARALGAQTNQLNVIFGESKQEIMDWARPRPASCSSRSARHRVRPSPSPRSARSRASRGRTWPRSRRT